MTYSIKQKIGAILYDLPLFVWTMGPSSGHGWVSMRNRNERLIRNAENVGAQCDWQWTSDLHIAKVFPTLGLKLMRRALNDRPVVFENASPTITKQPDVSFIIGHRGQQRVPHLVATLQTIAAQVGASIECIVVEQSARPEIKDSLPTWVRYIHDYVEVDAPYCRSRAFNLGASVAHGDLLILHDNDLLAPRSYASEVLKHRHAGYEVINLKRFIFYLSKDHTLTVINSRALNLSRPPEVIMQNAQGGGSLAVSRKAYLAIGGFDESFIGWGGEDNEFWERAQTRRVWPYGYLPLVHLWHESQKEKSSRQHKAAELFEQRSSLPAEIRIAELTARNFQANN